MNEFGYAAIWYLAVQAFGLAALPLCLRLFQRLPGRGYGLSKPLGLVLAGWVYWILGTFGVVRNSQGSVLLALGFVLAAGVLATARRVSAQHAPGVHSPHRMAAPWRVVVATEVLFAVAYVAWTLVRSRMPRIEPAGGEKWMEIAFLRAILRSDLFPPHDPWLSGFAISYYYFGYVIIAMLTQLSGVPAAVAFNLGISGLFALTCAASYSLVYMLIALRGERRGALRGPPATGWALLGPLLLTVMGNLESFLEVLHARGIGWAGFWRWLDVGRLAEPPPALAQGSWIPSRFFWWWQASRVVHDTAPWGGDWEVIDEFPAFSFILGDMHPHVLALPFVLLAIGMALNIYVRRSEGPWRGGSPYRLFAAWPLSGWETLVYAVCLGGLGFLNTWDFPVYLALVAAAFGLACWRSGEGERLGQIVGKSTRLFVGLLAGGVALYLPFWIGLQTQASGLLPNLFNPTRPVQFFVMFAPLLVICTAFVFGQARRAHAKVRRLAAALLLAIACVAVVVALTVGLALLLDHYGRVPGGGPVTYLSAWVAGKPIYVPGSGSDVTGAVVDRLRQRPAASGTALSLIAGVVAIALALGRSAANRG